jgi:hypothetical protein
MDAHKTPVFALIHSPLVGPFTWSNVANELRANGFEAIIPPLVDDEVSDLPYWKQHAQSVKNALNAIPQNRLLCLVGHSGAGPILPVIRNALTHTISAFVYVDAGVPVHNTTRLDMMREEIPDVAHEISSALLNGQRIPNWRSDDLRDILPDPSTRANLLAELKPRPLEFFTEPIPAQDNWLDAPCCYLQFSAGYDYSAQQARYRGWNVLKIDGGHFHMLADPAAVADVLINFIS